MRLRYNKNAKSIIQENSNYVITHQEGLLPINTTKPIYIEIGMGKGKFIYTQAQLNPNNYYIGIEKEESVMVQALKKQTTNPLPNLLLVVGDANNIDTWFNQKVSKIYLNFSDPWPKTRHHKRRLTSPTFLKNYQKILLKDGDIELKTDNRDLFCYSVMMMNNLKMEIIDISVDLHQDKTDIITTEYEERFLLLDKPIYYINVKF